MYLSASSISGPGMGRARMIARTAAMGAAFTLAAITAAQASSGGIIVSSEDEKGIVHATAGPVTPAKGWQGPIDYTVPVGKDIIFSYQCPSTLPIPVSGSFNPNPAAENGIILAGNYRRDDVTTDWAWAINWPAGGPAGAHIIFNVYCIKPLK